MVSKKEEIISPFINMKWKCQYYIHSDGNFTEVEDAKKIMEHLESGLHLCFYFQSIQKLCRRKLGSTVWNFLEAGAGQGSNRADRVPKEPTCAGVYYGSAGSRLKDAYLRE